MEKEVSERESIIISKSELEERLKKINKVLEELSYNTKSVVRHVEELISIIDVEGFKADIDTREYIKLLEETINNIKYIVEEFTEQLVYSKIEMYSKEDMYDKYGFEESSEDRDLGVVIIEDLNKPAMIFTDYKRVSYYIRE